jgi:hypothetical protein
LAGPLLATDVRISGRIAGHNRTETQRAGSDRHKQCLSSFPCRSWPLIIETCVGKSSTGKACRGTAVCGITVKWYLRVFCGQKVLQLRDNYTQSSRLPTFYPAPIRIPVYRNVNEFSASACRFWRIPLRCRPIIFNEHNHVKIPCVHSRSTVLLRDVSIHVGHKAQTLCNRTAQCFRCNGSAKLSPRITGIPSADVVVWSRVRWSGAACHFWRDSRCNFPMRHYFWEGGCQVKGP